MRARAEISGMTIFCIFVFQLLYRGEFFYLNTTFLHENTSCWWHKTQKEKPAFLEENREIILNEL